MQTLESREACHGQVMMVKITSPVRWLLKKQIQFDLEKLNKWDFLYPCVVEKMHTHVLWYMLAH